MTTIELNDALRGATLTCGVHDDVTGREHEEPAKVIEEVREGTRDICYVRYAGEGREKPRLKSVLETLAEKGECVTYRDNDYERRAQRAARLYPIPPRESYTLTWRVTRQQTNNL